MNGPREKSAAELLGTPVQFLKGVGPDRGALLARLGLKAAADLLFFFPRDYEDLSELRPIARLEEEQPVSVCGTVEEVDLRDTGGGRSMLGVLLRDDTEHLRAVWFNQPFLRQKFRRGDRLLVSGTPKRAGIRWEMHHPKTEHLREGESPPAGRILPVYPLTEGISQHQMRRIVQAVVESRGGAIDEALPDELLDAHGLWPIQAALPQIHQPHSRASLDQARRRFIFQELFVLQLALAMRRHALHAGRRAAPLPAGGEIDARIIRRFPFDLTADQQQAIAEVAADMAREIPMNRLLHGDVGSGKTVVAVYAMLLAVAHGRQGALMSPTEVLARQHYRNLERMLSASRVRLALLTGALAAGERKRLLEQIAAGEVDIVVGTHAVIGGDVRFARLGLAVIDEQHRFGVRQREKLRQAGLDPHYLVMTATPIPRTMTMTLYGDLDVSTIRELPPGRKKMHTYLGDAEKRPAWWEFFRKKLREGRQGFVITPLVDESSAAEAASVEQSFEQLTAGELADFRLDLVHGRMPAEAKEGAMLRFKSGETQVLVATSIVEVGVDVPNATVMTIEGAERFGLAQLHQLRGRVGRGEHPGYVCLFGEPTTPEARGRLEAVAKTSDGFELAEIDFDLRGPGDLFSTRQHGLPPLLIADLRRDAPLLAIARTAAHKLIAEDPLLAAPSLSKLRRQVVSRYGAALELVDVG